MVDIRLCRVACCSIRGGMCFGIHWRKPDNRDACPQVRFARTGGRLSRQARFVDEGCCVVKEIGGYFEIDPGGGNAPLPEGVLCD